jgi:hypothetical protein
VTTSLMDKEVDKLNTRDAPEYFGDLTRDGVTKAVTFKLQETVKRRIIHDGVRSGSRQYENFYGSELTASGFTRDAVKPKNLYIVFYFSFVKRDENFGIVLEKP